MKNKIYIFFGCALICVGIGIFLYPKLINRHITQYAQGYMDELRESIEAFSDDDTACSIQDEAIIKENSNSEISYAELYMEFIESNSSDPIGFIQIPSIECILPVYYGASTENLSKGAAVMQEADLPLGGINTNCVIAAHRGYRGNAYFRNINYIEAGDLIYVLNPWETLIYKAVSSKVVEPTDTNALDIQEGRDILTLVSCHPYVVGGGSKRYIVICERVYEDTVNTDEDKSSDLSKSDSSNEESIALKDELLELENGIIRLLPVCFLAAGIICILRNINPRKKA